MTVSEYSSRGGCWLYTDDYDSDPRPNIVTLRNRAFVVKFNRLFRL